jgi:hypothetical protein
VVVELEDCGVLVTDDRLVEVTLVEVPLPAPAVLVVTVEVPQPARRPPKTKRPSNAATAHFFMVTLFH